MIIWVKIIRTLKPIIMEEQFNLLHSKYYLSIKGYIYKRVKVKEIAEDITQDVFMKFYIVMKSGEYSDIGRAKQYLYTTAHNLTANHFVLLSYKSLVYPKEDFWVLHQNFDNDLFEGYCHKETLDQVMSIINNLSKENVETFNLKHLNDLKIREIALLLDIPEGTVKSRLNYCDKVLKRRGFEMIKFKKTNKAKLQSEIWKKKKLIKLINLKDTSIL